MSVSREVELSCDGLPGERLSCTRSRPIFARTARAARREAREAGWKVNQRGAKDYCPKCAAERADQTAEDARYDDVFGDGRG